MLAIQLVLEVASMQHLTVTYDEPQHFRYGQNLLRLDSTRFDDSKMPVSALNALPARLGALLAPGPLSVALGRLETARYVTVLFSLLLAFCVYCWARDLYGPPAGLLALTLCVFDPNLLAHSQLVTTDVYAAGLITFSLYLFWRFLERGGWGPAASSALALGLAQLAKYTALLLYPLFVLIVLGRFARDLWRVRRERRIGELGRRLLVFGKFALFFPVISLLVINAAFLFNQGFLPLDAYQFRSDFYRSVQASLGALRVPVPYPFLEGLDWVIQRERTGKGYGNLYLLGELRHGEGFTGYYFYACLYKLPIATQLLLLASVVVYAVRFRRFDFWKNEWVPACPIIAFTLYFNFFYRAQLGIRFFLVVFPLLYVFCGSLLRDAGSLSRTAKASLAAMLAFLILSVLSYYPHFLPYFNELVGDRTQAYKILADSNIDWGQSRWYLEQYQKAHPEVIVEPEGPTAGTIIVGVNRLTGVFSFEQYRWLRENFQPVGHVAYSYLIFDVSPSELERVKRLLRRRP
ncbi:MAG TPA: glycosyltransferase family 39 protein [Methylomirabilota bacterium]|nr:glycosyltransferase family 39 protein [Methylomirabilota bacterium]